MSNFKSNVLTICRRLTAALFETKDFDEFVSYLHPDVVWVDVTIDRTYQKAEEVSKIFFDKYFLQANKYVVKKEQYNLLKVSENQAMIFGSFMLHNTAEHVRLQLNLSALFVEEEGNIKVMYLNTAVPLSATEHKVTQDYVEYLDAKKRLSSHAKDTSDFKIALDNTNELLVTVDLTSSKLITSESKFENFFGVKPISKYHFRPLLVDLGVVYEKDLQKVLQHSNFANIKQLADSDMQYTYYEFRIVHPKQGVLWISENIIPVKDESGRLIKVLARFRNITEQKEKEIKRSELLKVDVFTGLYNKNHVISTITNFLSHPSRFSSSAVMLLDVDNFKEINDKKGHLFGDKAIAEIARLVKEEFRASDIVGRFGGDEFIVFLKDLPSREIVEEKANKLIEKFKHPLIIKDEAVQISISIGISYFPLDGNTFDELFQKADEALYKAKSDGKSKWRTFDDSF